MHGADWHFICGDCECTIHLKKPKRHVDEELLAKVRKEPCANCQKKPPSDPHHLISRGAGGGDYEWNVVPLCRKHHTEIHKRGLITFADDYRDFCHFLFDHGWTVVFDPDSEFIVDLEPPGQF